MCICSCTVFTSEVIGPDAFVFCITDTTPTPSYLQVNPRLLLGWGMILNQLLLADSVSYLRGRSDPSFSLLLYLPKQLLQVASFCDLNLLNYDLVLGVMSRFSKCKCSLLLIFHPKSPVVFFPKSMLNLKCDSVIN